MSEPRYFLITVGISEYDRLDCADQLPSAAEDMRTMTELFCADLGYNRVLQDIAPSPRAAVARERLAGWLGDRDRRENDRLVLYWSGHGETGPDGRHYLLGRDFDGQNFLGRALATEDIGRMMAGSAVRHVLLMIDTCYAGAGILDLTAVQRAVNASRPEKADISSGIYLVAASRPRGIAREGVFAQMFVDAVNAQRHGGWRQPFLDPQSVVRAINERMLEERAGQQVMINVVDSDGGISPVLRNPRHDERVPDGIVVEEGRRLLKRPDLLAHWSPRARGVGLEAESGDHFEGRFAVLRALVAWLEEDQLTGQRVVTGGPGSGKSAVLARLALTSDADYRAGLDTAHAAAGTLPKIGAIDVAIHARGKTVADVLSEVAAGLDADPVVALIAETAANRAVPPTVLVDAVDEALEPRGLARELLRPLAESRSVKLLVGTRKHVIPSLGAVENETFDLDEASRWFDIADVERYVDRLLERRADSTSSPYADAPELRKIVATHVAQRAGATFLIARLVARSLADRDEVIDIGDTAWIARLPRTVGEAFEEWLDRFGDEKQRVRDLLRPLAYANGGGFPWEDIWPRAASAIAGKPYGDGDIEWLLETAGAFVIETRQADRSAYRLFHEALAEHLRPPDRDQVNQARIAAVLTDTVPISDGHPDWFAALSYVRWHLSTHAADGNAIEGLVDDPAFLVAAEPMRLTRALSSSSAPSVVGVRSAYRGALHLMQGTVALERASYLELYAQRHLVDDLAARVAARFGDRPWRARWTKFRADSEHFVPGMHDKFVLCVATSTINGRAVAASGGTEESPRLWDLDAGAPIGRQPTRRPGKDGASEPDQGRITMVGFTHFHGEPVLVSKRGYDWTLDVWDPETGEPLGEPLQLGIAMQPTGDDDTSTWRMKTSVGPDRVLAVLSRFDWGTASPTEQQVVEVTGLHCVKPIDSFLNGHRGMRSPDRLLQCGDQVFVLFRDSPRHTAHDLESGAEVGPGFDLGTAVTGGLIAGRPAIAFVDWQGRLDVRDLLSGSHIVHPLDCEVGLLRHVKIGMGNGTPIAVVAGNEQTLRVIDLERGKPVGGAIAGHMAGVTSLALGTLDDRSVIVSGGDDRTVRVWDVEAGLHTTAPRADYPGGIRSVAIGRLPGDNARVLVTVGRDENLRLIELAEGREQAPPEKAAQAQQVAVRTCNGKLTAAVGTSEGLLIHELAQGRLTCRGRRGAGERCRGLQIIEVDGKNAFVAGRDRQVWIYGPDPEPDPDTPTVGHEGGVTALAIAEGREHAWALSGGGEGTLLLWNLGNDRPTAPAVQAHQGHVTAVALTDPERVGVAVSAGSDGQVRTWDLRTLEEFGPRLEGHTDWVRSIAVGWLDGEPVIATGGDDYTLRLWTLNGESLHKIMLAAPVRSVAMSDATVAAGTDAGLIAIDIRER